jgi:hypothetical protein
MPKNGPLYGIPNERKSVWKTAEPDAADMPQQSKQPGHDAVLQLDWLLI